MLQPKPFLALGQLPYLQSLAVFSSGAEPAFTRIDIPEDSFAALCRLEVHDLRSSCIEALWSVTSLVNRLTQVTVQTSFIGSDDPWINVARVISARTSLISELHLDFGHGYTPLLSKFISHFHRVCLTTLVIGGQPQLGPIFPQFVLGLPSCLEVLKIRGERPPIKFMPQLAKHLSNLRLLALGLLMYETANNGAVNVVVQAVEPGCEPVGRFVLQSSWEGLIFSSPERTESMAWLLHILWPNIKCEFFPEMDCTTWEKWTKDENAFALLQLNRRLDSLRLESLANGSLEVVSVLKS